VFYTVALKKNWSFCEIQRYIIACVYVVSTVVLGQFLSVTTWIFHVDIITPMFPINYYFSTSDVEYSAPVQTGPGAHPVSYTMGTGSFPGVKRPGRGVDHPLPSSAEVKQRVELYLCSPSGLSWPVLERTLPLPLPTNSLSRVTSQKSEGLYQNMLMDIRIHPTFSHPIPLKFICILFSHLFLGLLIDLFLSSCLTKFCMISHLPQH
jgi:hypothetical protein